MKLKRLEISGFKSFAETMALDFNADITGIIGPNGCGKSNVVDAIRWVMGELSAKQLRGAAMADVIFNGTESRGPQGMAEVTLTLSTAGGEMPPLYRSYDEIAVRRRLYSNGDSEYFINKVKVRLRDIQDLFLDTGVGTKGAYAIIEQGRIGSIILGQAEERRRMIDEVAGISKFKARRQGAEKRLEATGQSLERLDEMAGELRRRANVLRKQAAQAQRYKELKTRLTTIEEYELVMRYLEAQASYKYFDKEVETLAAAESEIRLALTMAETELAARNLESTAADDNLRQVEAIKQHLTTGIATLERDIVHGREEIELCGERRQHLIHDEEEAVEQIKRLEQSRAAIEVTVRELQENLQLEEGLLAESNQELSQYQSRHREAQKELDSLAVELLESVAAMTRERNMAELVEKQRLEAGRRQEQARLSLEKLDEERLEALEIQKKLAQETERSLAIIEEFNFQHDELKLATDRVVNKRRKSQEELDALSEQLTKIRSRWESLDEIERRHDGYSSGLQTLLVMREEAGNHSILLKDLIQCPDDLEVALESLLGESLQYIVIDDAAEICAYVRQLKENHLGKAGFVCPLPEVADLEAARPLPAGALCFLAERLDFSRTEGARAALKAILEHVVLFENLEAALSQSSLLQQRRLLAVTLQGDVIENGQLIRGGAKEAVSSGILKRQRELGELSLKIEELELRQQELQAAVFRLDETIEQNNLRLKELADGIARENLRRIAKEKEKQAAQYNVQLVAERLDVINYELEEAEKQQAVFAGQLAHCQQNGAAAEEKRSRILARQEELKNSHRQMADQLAELSEKCAQKRVKIAEITQKLQASLDSSNGQIMTRQELENRIEKLRQRQQREAESLAKISSQLQRDEETIKLYHEQIAQAEIKVAEQQAELAGITEKIAILEVSVKEKRAHHDQLGAALTEQKLLREKWAVELKQLAESAPVFYQREIADLIFEFHLSSLPDSSLSQEKETLRKELEAIGPAVNLLAIEEFAAVEKRLDFLSAQRADLEKAVNDLQQAIAKIERSSQERFNRAFAAVNEAFKKVFVKLFHGGRAELVLTASDSPLDGGLDIIAQPPGKCLQSLNLLSGGEKALTAAALVFALFLVRPSPFCLLDEVDAPLDEANIGRFLDLIKELSSETQFVIITHNQQTMGAAEVVYGVTMEERGVSKILSIKLKDAAE